MNEVLRLLVRMSQMGYTIGDWQDIISQAKGANIDESIKTEIINAAEQVLQAENKRVVTVANLLAKYNNEQNISAPPKPDDDPDDDE